MLLAAPRMAEWVRALAEFSLRDPHSERQEVGPASGPLTPTHVNAHTINK